MSDMMKMQSQLRIVEHVSGVWSYHIASEGEFVSLCGRQGMMDTKIPMSAWGVKDHIPSKWCRECEELARKAEEESDGERSP